MSGSAVTQAGPGESPSLADRSWVGALIILQGIVSIALVLVYFPAGMVAVIANAIAAVASRGVHRKLFATFAIVGALLCLIIGLTLLSVSFSGTTEVTELSALR